MTLHPAFRTSADLSVSSATRQEVAPELRKLDRMAGNLVVNRWTYRVLRLAGGLMRPPFDKSGVEVEERPEIGRGALVVTPDVRTGEGAVIFFHGGGMVIGSNADVLPLAADYARELGVPVICPSYRLAPQTRGSEIIGDCVASWRDALGQAEALGIDPAKIVIAGTSAGGGLAALLAQRLRDAGGQQPAAQLLIYPKLDDRTAERRELDTPRHRVWSNRNNRFGWTSYLGPDAVPEDVVPARCTNMAGLPPAWIGVGTCDLFLDEDRAYANALSEAGVAVSYLEVAGAIHGFDLAQTEMAQAFIKAQIAFLQPFVGKLDSQS